VQLKLTLLRDITDTKPHNVTQFTWKLML